MRMRIRSTSARVANLEAHAQLVGAVVQQQNGKDAVVNHGAHQVGHAMQQRLQIQRGIQRIRQPRQKVALHGIDSGFVAQRHGGAGAIVALIRVVFRRVLRTCGSLAAHFGSARVAASGWLVAFSDGVSRTSGTAFSDADLRLLGLMARSSE